jgi:hypothetical protein
VTGNHAADDARRRADEAGARAQQLRDRLDAAQAGGEDMHGSTPGDVDRATERASRATERLRQALESSAAAHDRAALAHETAASRGGDPDGVHVRQAADHRRDAAADRERLADLD